MSNREEAGSPNQREEGTQRRMPRSLERGGSHYYRVTLPEGELADVAISGQGVRSMFAIDYMRETVAAMRGEVLVLLGQDKSVRMSFTLHDANVTYIQAPRTE